MEPSTFQRETTLSTPYATVYTGPIESLAKNVGYMQWKFDGKPEVGMGWVFRTELPHVGEYNGENITQGRLGFNIEKIKATLMELGLITGRESVNYCDWMPPSPVGFRLFSEYDSLIDDNGNFSERDMHKSLRSATKGALETHVSSLVIIRNSEGEERRSSLEPGWVGIPPCWGEILGKYLQVNNYYILGNKNAGKYSELERELGLVSAVLSDVKFIVKRDFEPVWSGSRDIGSGDYAFQIKANLTGERDWLIESFQPTLERMMAHPDFQEALLHYSRMSRIKVYECAIPLDPSKVIRQQKQSTDSIYNPDLGEMVFRHYDPPLSRIAKVAERDKDMMTLLGLV